MPKTKPSRPSYTELGVLAILKNIDGRIKRLEDLVNEHGAPSPKEGPLPDGFGDWWTKLDGYSAEAKYIGEVSIYKSAALEIWKAALNSKTE